MEMSSKKNPKRKLEIHKKSLIWGIIDHFWIKKKDSVITKIVKNIEKIKTEKSGPGIHILHLTDTLTVDT